MVSVVPSRTSGSKPSTSILIKETGPTSFAAHQESMVVIVVVRFLELPNDGVWTC